MSDRIFGLQDKFRRAYTEIAIKPPTDDDKIDFPGEGGEINPVDFNTMVTQRDKFLANSDTELRGTFMQVLEIHGKYEKEHPQSYDIESAQRKILSFEVDDFIPEIVRRELITHRLDFNSYLLPLSFLLFAYLSGILVLTPLIESMFSHIAQDSKFVIPLFNNDKTIPLLAVQWGFFGGLVYTSVSMITRFLRKDLSPRVYLVSALRLLLASIVAIIIFLSSEYMYTNSGYDKIPIQVLLASFLAGVAPVQFLINFADSKLSRYLPFWRRRNAAGNRPLTLIEGINSIDADRLSEEGIDCIHHMAFCDPIDLSKATKYSVQVVNDWKDESILYVLTADIILYYKSDQKDQKPKQIYVFDHLNRTIGVRTFSGFKKLWSQINEEPQNNDKSLVKLLALENENVSSEVVRSIFRHTIAEGNRMKSIQLRASDLG